MFTKEPEKQLSLREGLDYTTPNHQSNYGKNQYHKVYIPACFIKGQHAQD